MHATIFSTTTLDFEMVKCSLEPLKSSGSDLIWELCSSDPGVLEVAQKELRKAIAEIDVSLMKGHTSSFAALWHL